jgi:hypothetical protein
MGGMQQVSKRSELLDRFSGRHRRICSWCRGCDEKQKKP